MLIIIRVPLMRILLLKNNDILRIQLNIKMKLLEKQLTTWSCYQKQPSRGVLRKRCFENMQQSYRTTPMQSNFSEITLWHWCSPVSLLHIFRTPFPKNTSGWLLLCYTKMIVQWTLSGIWMSYYSGKNVLNSAQKMIKNFFVKFDQIHSFLDRFCWILTCILYNFYDCMLFLGSTQ